MKPHVLAAVASVFLAVPAAASSVLIDFDSSPGGAIANNTVIATQYSSLGLTVSAFENDVMLTDAPIATTQYARPTQVGNRLANLSPADARADEIRLSFASPVSGIGFDMFPQNSGGSMLAFRIVAMAGAATLYDETFSLGSNDFYARTIPGSGITSVSLFQPSDSWNFGIDNLSYAVDDAAPVPLPMPVVLMGAGLMGLGMLRGRRALRRFGS